MVTHEPGNSGGRVFAVAATIGALGAGALLGGVSLVLGRTGNASNHLADLGFMMLIAACVANLAAIAMGLHFMLVQKVFLWWWPISLLLAGAAVSGGVIASGL